MRAKWLTRAEKSPPEHFSSLTSDKSSAKVRSIHAKPRGRQKRIMEVVRRPPPMLAEIDMLGLPDSNSLFPWRLFWFAQTDPGGGRAHHMTSHRAPKRAAGAEVTPWAPSPLQRRGSETFSSRSIS